MDNSEFQDCSYTVLIKDKAENLSASLPLASGKL